MSFLKKLFHQVRLWNDPYYEYVVPLPISMTYHRNVVHKPEFEDFLTTAKVPAAYKPKNLRNKEDRYLAVYNCFLSKNDGCVIKKNGDTWDTGTLYFKTDSEAVLFKLTYVERPENE